MLCSSCSRTLRPIVAVDIDGTLADYHGPFTQFVANYLGADPPEYAYNGRIGFRAWTQGTFDIDQRTWEDIKLAYRQGAQKRMLPITTGAKALMDGLIDYDLEVWITTTRPHLRLDGIDPDTRAWLRRHGIEYHGLLYDDDKYARLAEYVEPVRVVAVVDDLREQLEAAERALPASTAIKRSSPYNRRDGWEGTEFSDLSDLLHYIADLTDQWRGRHGNK